MSSRSHSRGSGAGRPRHFGINRALWTKILGVLLILLGLMLLASPWVTYTRREKAIQTPTTNVTVKREKNVIVPRPVSVLIILLGVLALVHASRRGNPLD